MEYIFNVSKDVSSAVVDLSSIPEGYSLFVGQFYLHAIIGIVGGLFLFAVTFSIWVIFTDGLWCLIEFTVWSVGLHPPIINNEEQALALNDIIYLNFFPGGRFIASRLYGFGPPLSTN